MENNLMSSSPIELIGSLSSSIQEVKEIYRLIKPIKNTLLSSKKNKNIAELEEKIEYTEAQIQELILSVTGLSKLVTSYADLISDVRIATASSDKFS